MLFWKYIFKYLTAWLIYKFPLDILARGCYRLCKLLTSPILEVKELAADFLFVLCKESGKIGL